MKIFLFNMYNIQLLVKAPNEFMATCYANQWQEKRYVFRFETSDAIEVDNDMDFGVIASITAGSIEMYNSENRYYYGSSVINNPAIVNKKTEEK